MLSKSHARAFFIGGTGFFSAIFLGLTFDSMKKIPNLTNDQAITAEVKHGKSIWEDNNCMGCHTLFGEGAYYAPELTKVVDRRGAAWIKMFLKDPAAMFPNERKMVQYNFTGEQIDAVVAFLDWCGKVDLNGFPAKPKLQQFVRSANPSAVAANAGPKKPEIFATICSACHAVGGVGGAVGPALDDVHKRLTREALVDWIGDPPKIKPGTIMPKLPLTQQQIEEVADYLLSLK